VLISSSGSGCRRNHKEHSDIKCRLSNGWPLSNGWLLSLVAGAVKGQPYQLANRSLPGFVADPPGKGSLLMARLQLAEPEQAFGVEDVVGNQQGEADDGNRDGPY